MKKILFGLVISAISIANVSCSKDQDDDDFNFASITGKWVLVQYGDQNNLTTHQHLCSTQNDYVDFGSTSLVYREYNENCDEHKIVGTYSILENSLSTVTVDGDETTVKSVEILTLDHQTMRLKDFDSNYMEVWKRQ